MGISKSNWCYCNLLTLSNARREIEDRDNSGAYSQNIDLLESGRGAMAEDSEKVELVTRLGTRITITLCSSSELKAEKIILTVSDILHPKENMVEMEVEPNAISLTTQQDLLFRARNVEIIADKTMRLKSGSTMTINGSLIRIN
jgi:hypothetical protein